MYNYNGAKTGLRYSNHYILEVEKYSYLLTIGNYEVFKNISSNYISYSPVKLGSDQTIIYVYIKILININ
jgi:hypothetical protein